MGDDLIDLGGSDDKYNAIAGALLGDDERETSDLDLVEINALSFLRVLIDEYGFKSIEGVITNFIHYRVSLKRSSRVELVDTFRSLLRERPEFNKNQEEDMLK